MLVPSSHFINVRFACNFRTALSVLEVNLPREISRSKMNGLLSNAAWCYDSVISGIYRNR